STGQLAVPAESADGVSLPPLLFQERQNGIRCHEQGLDERVAEILAAPRVCDWRERAGHFEPRALSRLDARQNGSLPAARSKQLIDGVARSLSLHARQHLLRRDGLGA